MSILLPQRSASTTNSWHIQTVSQASSDSYPAFIVSFDNAKYLFGCGPGTSRSLVQHSSGFSKFKSIFLPSLEFAQREGLPGMLLSLQKKGDMSVVGPEGLNYYIATNRNNVRRDQIALHPTEVGPRSHNSKDNIVHSDENMTVYAIPANPELRSPSPTSPLKRKRSPSPSAYTAKAEPYHSRDVVMAMFPGSNRVLDTDVDWSKRERGTGKHAIFRSSINLLPCPHNQTALSYYMYGSAKRGKFDVNAAKALNIPKGPLWQTLTTGTAVQMEDGTWIQPSQVLGPEVHAAAVLFSYCPSPAYINSLLSSEVFKPEFHVDSTRPRLRYIIHVVGDGVLEDPRYTSWMKSFDQVTYPSVEPKNSDNVEFVKHLVASRDYTPNTFTFGPAALFHYRLSMLDSEIYPIGEHYARSRKDLSGISGLPSNTQLFQSRQYLPVTESHKLNYVVPEASANHAPLPISYPSEEADTAASELIRPHHLIQGRKGKHQQVVQAQQKLNYENGLKQWQAYRDAIPAVREKVEALAQERLKTATGYDASDELTVISLGTGSAVPSKYRNVSGTLVKAPSGLSILLDCGEGTFGQLSRRFGEARALELLIFELRVIFISHQHADHVNGLHYLLFRRSQAIAAIKAVDPYFEPPILRLCISYFGWKALQEQQSLPYSFSASHTNIKPIDSVQPAFLIPNGFSKDGPYETSNEPILKELGFSEFNSIEVSHRCRAFGLIARHQEGWSFAYSGDTMPCDSMVQKGQMVSLVIHEATMEDGLEQMAQEKGHSTYSQAVSIARRMHAKYCYLTHFSSRYPKAIPQTLAPPTADPTDISEMTTVTAFDFMSLRLKDAWKMPHYSEALSVLFSECEPDDTTEIPEGEDATPPSEGAVPGESKAQSKKKAKLEKKAAAKLDGMKDVKVEGNGKGEKKPQVNGKQKPKNPAQTPEIDVKGPGERATKSPEVESKSHGKRASKIPETERLGKQARRSPEIKQPIS